VAAIGNGRSDRLMLQEAALALAVVEKEGASREALLAADVICVDILSALARIIHEIRLVFWPNMISVKTISSVNRRPTASQSATAWASRLSSIERGSHDQASDEFRSPTAEERSAHRNRLTSDESFIPEGLLRLWFCRQR